MWTFCRRSRPCSRAVMGKLIKRQVSGWIGCEPDLIRSIEPRRRIRFNDRRAAADGKRLPNVSAAAPNNNAAAVCTTMRRAKNFRARAGNGRFFFFIYIQRHRPYGFLSLRQPFYNVRFGRVIVFNAFARNSVFFFLSFFLSKAVNYGLST